MAFTNVPTEQTTAITDALLAVVGMVCMYRLRRYRDCNPWRVGVWSWVLGLLVFAAALGAVVHGFDWGEATKDLLWQPLFLALGLVVGLFVVAAVHDFLGGQASRRLVPVMVAVGVGFFVLTRVVAGTFLVFVVYEAVAMVVALVLYATLAIRRTLPGAGTIALAVVLNIAAAAVQASGSVAVTVVVPFDHNGVFHLVQTVAVVVLYVGLERGMLGHPRSHGGDK
jgi:hypothetical protein